MDGNHRWAKGAMPLQQVIKQVPGVYAKLQKLALIWVSNVTLFAFL